MAEPAKNLINRRAMTVEPLFLVFFNLLPTQVSPIALDKMPIAVRNNAFDDRENLSEACQALRNETHYVLSR